LDRRPRRGEEFNRRDIPDISGIELLAPTKRFGPRGGFKTDSKSNYFIFKNRSPQISASQLGGYLKWLKNLPIEI
jgi:hypothetical protein